MTDFKKQHTLNERILESLRLRNKYPNKVPIIISKDPKSTIQDIDRTKYLVSDDLTVGSFICIIRKRIKLESDQAIFLYINNKLPPVSYMLLEIYNTYKDQDGFLYITYSGENVFG
jgi:GABA(A) receptor-associated protein